jgi:glycosyltransferase involved in cell wall biosynthesis
MTDLAVRTCVFDIVIPVYNGKRDLPGSVRRLRITIADNASTDRTLAVATALAAELPDVQVIHVDEKGVGVASTLAFAFCLAITSGSLFLLHNFNPTVGRVVELSVLVVANLVATLIRFVALRRVFSV